MNNAVGLTFFAVGIVLLIFGLGEVGMVRIWLPGPESFWLSAAGLTAVAAGLWMAFRDTARR